MLDCIPQKDKLWYLENVVILGNKVFADIIKLK